MEEDRHHAFHWSRYHPGLIVDLLPYGFVPVYVGNRTYYYDDGVYYVPAPAGYVVAPPPVGAVVPVLPAGAEKIVADGRVYYYAAGAFYVRHPDGYEVVRAPLGVTVNFLPPGAVPVMVRGKWYYQAAGGYFMPVMQDGATVYVTVQP